MPLLLSCLKQTSGSCQEPPSLLSGQPAKPGEQSTFCSKTAEEYLGSSCQESCVPGQLRQTATATLPPGALAWHFLLFSPSCPRPISFTVTLSFPLHLFSLCTFITISLSIISSSLSHTSLYPSYALCFSPLCSVLSAQGRLVLYHPLIIEIFYGSDISATFINSVAAGNR